MCLARGRPIAGSIRADDVVAGVEADCDAAFGVVGLVGGLADEAFV
jgi:hypothetical protein